MTDKQRQQKRSLANEARQLSQRIDYFFEDLQTLRSRASDDDLIEDLTDAIERVSRAYSELETVHQSLKTSNR